MSATNQPHVLAHRLTLILSVALTLFTFPQPARAQSPDSEDALAETAKALTKAGVADYAAGKYAEAAAKFSEAYKTYPKSELLLNLSRTQKHLAQCDKALDYAQRYLKTVTGSDPTLEQAGLDELAHLRAECPEVQVFSSPTGASLWIETDSGPPVGTTPWVGRLFVGHRVFILKSPGLPDSHQTVELVAGSSPTFTFSLSQPPPVVPVPVAVHSPPVAPVVTPPVAPPPEPPPPEFTALPEEHPAPPPPPPPVQPAVKVAAPEHLEENHPPVHRMSTLRSVGLASSVVGALALASAIILGANVASETSGLHTVSSTRTGSQAQQIINDTQTKATAANALYVVGGITGAAGIGLVIFF